MEALGLAFSVAPLLGGSVKVVRIYRRWKNVHDDLDRAAARVEKLRNFQEALSLVYGDLPEEKRQLIPDPVRAGVLVSKALPKAITKRSKTSYLRWLIGDREVFEKVMSEFEKDIGMSGSLLNIQWHAARTPNDFNHDQPLPLQAVTEPQRTGTSATEAEQWDPTKGNIALISFPLPYFSSAVTWICRQINRLLDLQGSLLWIVRSIPLVRIVPARHCTKQDLAQLLMHISNMVHRLLWQRWLESLPYQGRLQGSHEVSLDNEFFRASREGNVVRMQQLLVLREASPFATTAEGITALCLAIQYGRHDAVKLLLSQGALVNRAFGVKQTSPLCWALKHRQLEICRTLLSHGASFDHSTVYNWSPLFYLWPWDIEEGFRHPPASEFITMLRAKGEEFHVLYEDLVDNHGWSLMHRAAVFADPADLQLLMDYGVDPFQRFAISSWTALHLVARYGINENFAILFQAYEKKFGWRTALELRDSRGWTPLHRAASNGHFELVRILLDSGADRTALTGRVNDRDMPESIQGKTCSPQELAWAFGESRGRCFDDIAAAIPEDQWSDAPEYPEGDTLPKRFKLPGLLLKEMMKNMSAFLRRSRQSRQVLN